MDSILIIDPSVSTFAFPPQPEDTVHSSLDHLSDIPSPTSSTPPDSPPLNPPPSPMTSTDCAGDVLPDNLIDNISHQLTRQLAHDVSSLETNNTISGLSLINDALLKSANQHNHPFIFDEFYEGYTAQSPVHQGIDQISAAWIILHHGTLGRAPSSGSRGLSSGSFICLFDTSLALHNLGFEQPLLYTQLGRPFIVNAGITFSDPPLTSMSQLASSILSTSTVPSPLSPSQMLLLLLSSSSACPSMLTCSGNESCQMNILCILLFENGRRILHGSTLSGIRSSSG